MIPTEQKEDRERERLRARRPERVRIRTIFERWNEKTWCFGCEG